MIHLKPIRVNSSYFPDDYAEDKEKQDYDELRAAIGIMDPNDYKRLLPKNRLKQLLEANGYTVTENMTLTAKWTPIMLTVTFDTNGGSVVDSQTIAYNSSVVKPKNPTKSGYTFVGWYSDEEHTELFDFSTKIVEDIILYAKWDVIGHRVGLYIM